MRRILNNNLRRQLEIVECLVEFEIQTIGELQQSIDVDEKTIKKDIQIINNLIEPVKVESDQLNYQIIWPEKWGINHVYAKFLEVSLEFQVLELVIIEEKFNYSDLAERFFISISTLRRMLSRMKEILKDYNLIILTNPVRIRGSESNILNFLSKYLKEKYLVTSNYLSCEESQLMDEILAVITKTWTYTTSEALKWHIKSYIIRYKQGNQMSYKVNYDSRQLIELTTKTALFHPSFQTVFGMPFTLEIVGELFQESYALNYQHLLGMAVKDSTVSKKVNAVEGLVNVIEENYEIYSQDKGALITRLYNMMYLSYGDKVILYDKNQVFINELKKRKFEFLNLLEEHYQRIAPDKTSQSFAKFAFLLVTEWEELVESLRHQQKTMKIGLFFSTTRNHIHFIKEEFQRGLGYHFEIISLNNFSDKTLNESKVDLIVTNISNLPTHKNSLCVSEFPKENDFQRIKGAYKNWNK